MKTTEIVIYKVKDENLKSFNELSKLADRCLSNQKGYISRTVKRNMKNENTYIDIVEWENLDCAENAAKAILKNEDIKPFFEATEEMIHFEHYGTV